MPAPLIGVVHAVRELIKKVIDIRLAQAATVLYDALVESNIPQGEQLGLLVPSGMYKGDGHQPGIFPKDAISGLVTCKISFAIELGQRKQLLTKIPKPDLP